MAKVSVYIPDELLERARSVSASSSTSQLVQLGLEKLTAHLADAGEPEYASRPEDAQKLLTVAHAKLMASARSEFEGGYRAGLRDVGELDWGFLESLARDQFNLAVKLPALRSSVAPAAHESFSPPAWFDILVKSFGALIDPIGFDQWGFKPAHPFVIGYGTALRDAWSLLGSGPGGALPEGESDDR